MSEELGEQWPVGSPAWQQQQEAAQLAAIANIGDVFEDPEPEPEVPETPAKPGTTYTWTQEDNWATVAKRFNLTRQELLDHNDIDDPDAIKPGDSIHLPFVQDMPRDMSPTFEVLPEPLPMHVKKPGGCKKWSFGNMKKWDDAKSAGFFPQDSNLTIVAIAHVPIDEPELEAAYCMDAIALGDYEQTGHIKWTIGYMWSDLAEGHVDKSAPPPVAQRVIKKQKAEAIAKKAVDIASAKPNYLDGFDKPFIEKRLADIVRDGADHFKLTRQVLPQPIPCTATIPDDVGQIDKQTGKRFVWIHDFDTKRPDRKLWQNQEITISQTFEYGGVLYGRPVKAVEAFNWYGIDMNLLQSDDDLYNVQPAAATRAAAGNTLTWSERFVWVPLAKVSAHPILERRRQRKQKNNEKRT